MGEHRAGSVIYVKERTPRWRVWRDYVGKWWALPPCAHWRARADGPFPSQLDALDHIADEMRSGRPA